MSWEFTNAVDTINQNGGFITHETYLLWRDRAGEIDLGATQPGEFWGPYLTTDYNNGLLDYEKGYLPLWKLFVQGIIPPPPNGNGGFDWSNIVWLLLIGILIYSFAKKKRVKEKVE